MGRRLIGFAVRDNLSSWASAPDTSLKPCYDDDVTKRYVWTGETAEADARGFIAAAKVDKGHGDPKEVRYVLVRIYRTDRKTDDTLATADPATTLANAVIRYFSAGHQEALMSSKRTASAIHSLVAEKGDRKQDLHVEESKRVHDEFKAAEAAFDASMKAYALAVPSSIPSYIPIEIGERHARTIKDIEWLGTMGMRL